MVSQVMSLFQASGHTMNVVSWEALKGTELNHMNTIEGFIAYQWIMRHPYAANIFSGKL